MTCLKRIDFTVTNLLSLRFKNCTMELGKRRIALQDALISIWDLESGTCVSRFELGAEYGAPPISICMAGFLAPQWRRAATTVLLGMADRHLYNTYDFKTVGGRVSCRSFLCSGHSEGVSCVLELEDGRRMSGSEDRTVKEVWDILSRSCLATTLHRPSGVLYLAGAFARPLFAKNRVWLS